MNKKILSLVLTLVMVLGAFTSVFAAETKTTEKVEKIVGKDNKIQYVIDKKLVEGYEDGSYQLDKNITRAEITKLLAIANGHKELAEKLQGAMKLYSDVDNSHWANGVITVGTTVPSASNGQPMLQGYPDGTFLPENNVTYAELAKMLVVLVKTDLTADMVKEANAKWAGLWLTWAQQLGILDDVTVADSNAAATRGDAFTMVYNALYKMQNFRRVAANEKLGVLSSLKRDKLVLNQDEKQTYTITTDTVFVNTTKKADYSNVIKVKDITNPDYYLGSLVRIIVNDKNEVTHILELGNPSDLALGLKDGGISTVTSVGDNARWNGVADATVETGFSKVSTLKDQTGNSTFNGYARIGFKEANNVKANKITFFAANNSQVGPTLKINDDTKIYVANPANNIMREVKDINEALSLIGYRNYNNFNIPNVYAGFDTDGHQSVIKSFQTTDKDTAKVIVFNVVSKSQDGDLYRVVNQTSSTGIATVENTDGKLFDRDFFNNMNSFPFNYGDLYDVIELNYGAANATDSIVTKIDHSKTEKFPIVEIIKMYNDKKEIEVRDEFGYVSKLDLRDADIFNAKQYADLKVGDKVQFATTNKSMVIDILSILPANTKVEGSMRAVVDSIYGGTQVGKLMSVSADGEPYMIYVEQANDIFNNKDNMGRAAYYVTRENAQMLKDYVGKELVFDVTTDMNGYVGKAYADNFRLNDANRTPITPSTNTLQHLLDLVDAANKLYNPDKVDAKNLEAAKAAEAAIQKAYDALNLADRNAYTTEPKYEGYRQANEQLVNQINAKQGEADKAAAAEFKKLAQTMPQTSELEKIEEQSSMDQTVAKINKVIDAYNKLSAGAQKEADATEALSWVNNNIQILKDQAAKSGDKIKTPVFTEIKTK